MTETPSAQTTAVFVRGAAGSASLEWFLIFTIGTILVTRAYLHLTGYPQIGSGALHIAHALWGGALMMLALLAGWLFLGPATRISGVVIGGIGFGLFLDEVGKFVTRDNDYFYGPSAEIMYVLVVLILVIGRIVRDVRRPTTAEALANAASIAADGVSHGLPVRRRQQAHEFLGFAAENGANETVIQQIRGLLDSTVDTPDRLMRLRDRAAGIIPNFFRSRVWVTLVGWMLVVVSALTIVAGLFSFAFKEGRRGDIAHYLELSRDHTATWILLISGIVTFVFAAPAMFARMRTAEVWPLRSLRLAALVFTLSNALVDFALEGFGALVNLAIGLFALSVITYQLGQAVVTSVDERGQLRV